MHIKRRPNFDTGFSLTFAPARTRYFKIFSSSVNNFQRWKASVQDWFRRSGEGRYKSPFVCFHVRGKSFTASMIKSIEKLKVRIDQNLNRAEKSEALSEDVVKIESKIASLKQVCNVICEYDGMFMRSNHSIFHDYFVNSCASLSLRSYQLKAVYPHLRVNWVTMGLLSKKEFAKHPNSH